MCLRGGGGEKDFQEMISKRLLVLIYSPSVPPRPLHLRSRLRRNSRPFLDPSAPLTWRLFKVTVSCSYCRLDQVRLDLGLFGT